MEKIPVKIVELTSPSGKSAVDVMIDIFDYNEIDILITDHDYQNHIGLTYLGIYTISEDSESPILKIIYS